MDHACSPGNLLRANAVRFAVALAVCIVAPPAHAAAQPDVVVMIHGAGGGGWEYDKWRPVFHHAGWRVVARDLVPAKGGLAATRFADYVKQVRSWVPKKRGRLVLVGASMGGILALKSAETLHPEAIVLVDSVPPEGVGAWHKAKPYPKIVRWAHGPLQDTRDAMPDSDEATIQWAWPRWRDESGAVLNAIAHGVPARKPLCRVLVVLGERDTDVPTDTGFAIARWANAPVHLCVATSHVGPLLGRGAAKVAEAARRWLDARAPAEAPR